MTWTATTDWSVGQLVTHTNMNTFVSTNLDVANRVSLSLFSSGTGNTTGFIAARFRFPWAFTIEDMWLGANTASTDGPIILDVFKSTDDQVTSTSTKFSTLFTSSSKFPTLTSGKRDGGPFVPDVVSVGAGDVLLASYVDKGSDAAEGISLIISLSGA